MLERYEQETERQIARWEELAKQLPEQYQQAMEAQVKKMREAEKKRHAQLLASVDAGLKAAFDNALKPKPQTGAAGLYRKPIGDEWTTLPTFNLSGSGAKQHWTINDRGSALLAALQQQGVVPNSPPIRSSLSPTQTPSTRRIGIPRPTARGSRCRH